MRDAPAAMGRQPFDFEYEQVEVVGTGGEPLQELLALADVQARLHAGVARAEAGDEPRRGCAYLGFDREAQALGLRLPERGQPGFGTREAVDQLAAGFEQRVAGP